MKISIMLIMLIIVAFLSGCSTNNTPTPNNTSINAISQKALYPVNINSKFGFIDSTGNLVVQPKYDLASDFNDGPGHVNNN